MKNIISHFIFALLCLCPFIDAACGSGCTLAAQEATTLSSFGEIDAKGLKALIDSEIPFVLIDARGDKWNDSNIIPGAQLASYENSQQELQKIISSENSLVVVYCYSATCPLSMRLVNRLLEWGYTNVILYDAGLKEWRDSLGYPVENIL